MRTLTANGLALQARLLAGEKVDVVPLLFMDLPVPQRWALGGAELRWGGETFAPFDVAVEGGAQDEVGVPGGLQITAPAVTEAQIALAVDPDVEGSETTLHLALVNPASGVVDEALQVGSYELDTPGWEDGPQALTHFVAESRAAVAMRPKVSRYTNDEQQRLYPGDTSLDFDPATDAAPLVWPAASFFKVPE